EELLARVVEVTLGAYEHQDLPFERLVEELQPPRDLSRHPLFQVMFQLQNAPAPPVELPGVTLGLVPPEDSETAKFDVGFFLGRSSDGLVGPLEYSTDLFDRGTMERLLRQYRTLLAEIVADPGRRLSDLPVLAPAELHQLLAEWNDTGASLPPVAGVAELFTAQAARTPERVALIFPGSGLAGGEQVSYRELERRSNRLARYLRGLGVGPEVPVGVAVDRSIELIVVILGVFKAGGFLVPLDRTLPADRLAFIIADAGVEIILTRRDSHEHLPPHSAHTVFLEALPKTRERERERERGAAGAADNLAYVIYTSGTTGRPKGISMVHRVLTNLTRWQLRSTAPDAGVRTPQFAP
ncbi:MAG: AMP-binding protein, partial [bacterium]|nr:AMP-binding protein [bacterium]